MVSIITSCGFLKQFSLSDNEDEMIISRKYIGNFIEYRYTGSEDIAGPNIIWIKTTMENQYGKISALGKNCEFKKGDRLYLKRRLYDPGIGAGYWIFYIENDFSVSYEATDFQNDHKISTESIFQNNF
jgi:hypothetical protein